MSRLLLYSVVLSIVGVLLFLILLAALLLDFYYGKYWNYNSLTTALITLTLLVTSPFIIFSLEGIFIKKQPRKIKFEPYINPKISIVLTAYNDELSVHSAVKDFKAAQHDELIVIDNCSTDRTAELAAKEGAKIVSEKYCNKGYGGACIRALHEASGDIIILSEADMTFSGHDVKKFLSYIENADMVIGTRTTQELLDQKSQLDWFLNWGNQFLARLLQLKHWGKVRLTDVGCTYRAIRQEAIGKIINKLTVMGSEFSPHMIDVALQNGLKVIEIPVVFRERVGESKAIGRNKIKGMALGLKMLKGILFKW